MFTRVCMHVYVRACGKSSECLHEGLYFRLSDLTDTQCRYMSNVVHRLHINFATVRDGCISFQSKKKTYSIIYWWVVFFVFATFRGTNEYLLIVNMRITFCPTPHIKGVVVVRTKSFWTLRTYGTTSIWSMND